MSKGDNGAASVPSSQSPENSSPVSYPFKFSPSAFPHPPAPGKHSPPGTKENVAFLLNRSGISVRYDVIKKRLRITRKDQILTENDIISLATLNSIRINWLLDFVRELAMAEPVNPVADWIGGRPWDGMDRLPDLYATVHVVDEFPKHARNFLLYRWLLSCVAAAFMPVGFKARGVLTFQGEQGVGKTSWIARLVPSEDSAEWVKLDHHLDAHNKDSIFGAITHWIVEIGELDGSFRKDIARIKGFLTNSVDKIRLPYARNPIELDRRTVFAGTVNEWNFLIDQTGNSRWWTIPVTKLDFEHGIDMQQVFAQLAVDYHNGEQWWLTRDEEAQLAALNTHHQAVSVIEERVRARIAPADVGRRYMTATQVLDEIGIRFPSNAQCKECGAVLRSIYGPPKRVNGLMKWKVAFAPSSEWQKSPDDDPDPEDIY